jgi:hypothetical protein
MDEFGRLEPVDLRTAWEHEAINFTPWLAENLDRLSQAIGIEMSLEDTEVKIDRFSADILARNAQDDSLVLIENQLEWSDHTHLGQILTYLAGLQAQSVIWVASGFEEAHLSAIRWLNEHTAEPFAFFAVRVGVVRIGASPMAPVFEVIERPLEWDRRVRVIAQERAGLSEIGQFRREFWTCYAERYPEDGVRPGHAGSNTWHRVEGMDHTVSQYLAQGHVGVYLRGGESRDDAKSCEDALGAELSVESNPNARESGHFAVSTMPVDTKERGNWQGMADWLHERLRSYQGVLEKPAAAPDSTTPVSPD